MTRAFLCMIHFKFADAIGYNPRVIIAFPLGAAIYIKYMFMDTYKILFKTGG